MALGGVLIGSDIAQLAATAMPRIMVEVPPLGTSASPITSHTKVKIGISNAAVAVFEIKLLRAKQSIPEIIRITIGFHSPNGMLFTAF